MFNLDSPLPIILHEQLKCFSNVSAVSVYMIYLINIYFFYSKHHEYCKTKEIDFWAKFFSDRLSNNLLMILTIKIVNGTL